MSKPSKTGQTTSKERLLKRKKNKYSNLKNSKNNPF